MNINKINATRTASKWQAALSNQKNNFMAKIIQHFLQAAMNEEFDEFIGAQKYERSENRNGSRNGFYERQLTTRVGSITLHVCRDRNGNFQTQYFEKYQRSEQALVLTIIELYISGTSTRKIGAVMQTLCGSTVSKSCVSELTKKIDVVLEAWRNRMLTEKYRYLVVDARYEKIRQHGHVVSKAFVVVIGITEQGIREIIGCWVINSESFQEWDNCFKDLKERGLHGVEYVVSDENKGLRAALQKHFQNVLLQRCQVHFMRNFIHKLAKSEQPEGIRLLHDVFVAPTHKDAVERINKVKEFLSKNKKDRVADWLEQNIEETLIVFQLPIEHRIKMRSTNMVERLNEELKRRSRVVRIFPNEESCLRLLGAVCMETSEQWLNKKYLNFE